MIRQLKLANEKNKKAIRPFTLYLDRNLYREIKLLSAEKDISMNELAREGVAHVLKKYGKRKKNFSGRVDRCYREG